MAASTAILAVPLPSLGAARAAAPARAGYAWAVSRAMARGSVSADSLALELGLSRRAARAHVARMVQRGVVSAPNGAGVARVLSPVFQASLRVQAGVAASTALPKDLTGAARTKGSGPLRRIVKDQRALGQTPAEPADAPQDAAPEPERAPDAETPDTAGLSCPSDAAPALTKA